MKTRNILLTSVVLLSLILSVSLVSAAVSSPGSSMTNMLSKIFGGISQFFMLDFLAGNPIGFLRFLLWLTVFMIFFGAGKAVFGRFYPDSPGMASRNAGVIAAVIATVTILFTPPDVMATIFESYTVLVLFLLLGIPIGGFMWFAYVGVNNLTENERARAAVRIIALLLVWWLLFKISTWGDKNTGLISFKMMLPISAYEIWNKYFSKKSK
jgi:hypothetical protein